MIKLVSSSKVTVTTNNKQDVVEKIFRDNDFVFSKKSDYLVGRLKDSESTLYIRIYNTKIKCYLYCDYEYHIYKTILHEDFLKRIKEENIFLILLKDKK